jgi:hypothetical protein
MTPAEFKGELIKFKALITEILGDDVTIRGFRAPTFSICNHTHWAFSILQEMGYTYDCSIVPVKTPLYGVRKSPAGIHILSTHTAAKNGNPLFLEFPITSWQFAGFGFPLGGLFLRILPRYVFVSLLRRCHRIRPLILYVHPWEITPVAQRVKLHFLIKLIMLYNADSVFAKLKYLLQCFSFTSVRDVLAVTVPETAVYSKGV